MGGGILYTDANETVTTRCKFDFLMSNKKKITLFNIYITRVNDVIYVF